MAAVMERVRGFTIIEVMTVVALTLFLALLAAPVITGSNTSGDLGNFSAEAIDALRDGQSAVMSGRNNARYGVHFMSDRFVLYQGSSFIAGDLNNSEHLLNGRVSITAVAFSPGGACAVIAGTGNCDIHFSNPRGIPTETGTVTFTGDNGQTKTVTINAAGMVDVN